MISSKKQGDIISFLKKKDYIMVNDNLGKGSFGKTVILKDPYVDELFVAKKYEPAYDDIKEAFYKNFIDEIKILYKLNHKNIVRIFNYYPYEELFTGYILMEFIDGQDIGTYFQKYDELNDVCGDPSPDDIFIQLVDAFCYIEDHGIIHRDIREGNILIDKSGVVKVIDFGIGKIADPVSKADSLLAEINRNNSDTLPQEYYKGEYTSLTDMFYLAELLNRLIHTAPYVSKMNFSYQTILDKMMNKNPIDRYQSFAEVRKYIGKNDFINLKISEDDKKLYQKFSNMIYRSLYKYLSEPKFVVEPKTLIANLQKALRNNIFEDTIQNNSDVINSIVLCNYNYNNRELIPCEIVQDFLEWYANSTIESQELILENLTSKLQAIPYEEPEPDLPF